MYLFIIIIFKSILYIYACLQRWRSIHIFYRVVSNNLVSFSKLLWIPIWVPTRQWYSRGKNSQNILGVKEKKSYMTRQERELGHNSIVNLLYVIMSFIQGTIWLINIFLLDILQNINKKYIHFLKKRVVAKIVIKIKL